MRPPPRSSIPGERRLDHVPRAGQVHVEHAPPVAPRTASLVARALHAGCRHDDTRPARARPRRGRRRRATAPRSVTSSSACSADRRGHEVAGRDREAVGGQPLARSRRRARRRRRRRSPLVPRGVRWTGVVHGPRRRPYRRGGVRGGGLARACSSAPHECQIVSRQEARRTTASRRLPAVSGFQMLGHDLHTGLEPGGGTRSLGPPRDWRNNPCRRQAHLVQPAHLAAARRRRAGRTPRRRSSPTWPRCAPPARWTRAALPGHGEPVEGPSRADR